MMQSVPSTLGPAVICVDAATPKNPNHFLSCQAWKVGMAPIIALAVCMREHDGGVNKGCGGNNNITQDKVII